MKNCFEHFPDSVINQLHEIDFLLADESAPTEVKELLNETVLYGGKRIRPLLLLLSGHLFGVEESRLSHLAIAVEHVHAASLAHDDVIDDAKTRRGRSSINIVASNKKAVLSGDHLLADVISRLTCFGNLDILQGMSNVIKDLSRGEWLQLEASRKGVESDISIEDISSKKTGSLISFALCAPAVLVEADESVIKSLQSIGRDVGLSFQLSDDILDFSPNSGKELAIDLSNGVLNSVLFELNQINPNYYRALSSGEVDLDLSNVDLINAIELVREKAHFLVDRANRELMNFASRLDISVERTTPLVRVFDMLARRTF